MNAKELIEAATRLRERHGEWRYVEGDSMYFKDVIASCDHILNTVRPDDDEPVTRERLEADGWKKWRSKPDAQDYIHSGVSIFYDENNEWFQFMAVQLKSMGHLRRFVAALGE